MEVRSERIINNKTEKGVLYYGSSREVIPNPKNKGVFERAKAADKSTIVNGIVLIQYNAIYDRRFSAL